ncbi:HXXEE domain-containing protein [Lederbergia citrea]|uniref:HXXEE domain-containing protein n=1 Tax=Lederbergia citrea TaxID=2833581 RepID=A0A942UKB0_9BACI|nr:HXXEE domain-containing protein [Lederbergia citrea]MBS4176507.1 HXXEE domain-containing protein [Lederbergia citrea]MBS4203068.1 HXXEE domain-containing protein [Lederbergia citrea]MBS4222260.1 HXXEE domain-containing protein [Lederbergia citrea]
MLEASHGFFYIETVIWLFPIIFMFHDLEEIITVENFMTKYKNRVPKTVLERLALTIKKKLGMKSAQLSITAVWILLIISFITFMTAYHLPIGGNFLLFTAVLNVFFLQTFSHIGQTVIFRGYTPGVITALVIVIPYSLLTYYWLFELNLIDGQLIFESIPFSILMVPIFLIGNLLGSRLIR